MEQMSPEQAKVLVIDDEEIILKSMRSIMKLEGYTADTASTASEGLNLIKRNSYEIIFIDLKLPDTNGIEVLKDIRKVDSEVAVIIITGYATIKSAISAIKMNAYDYILKPLDPDQIRNSLRSALKKKKFESEFKKRIQEPKVLLIGFGSDIMAAIAQRLVKAKIQRFLVKNSKEAIQFLKKDSSVNTLLVDLESERTDGMELLESVKRINPEIIFIPIASRPNLQEVIQLMKQGAFDYLIKPVKDEDLFYLLRQAWNYQNLTFINRQLMYDLQKTNEELKKAQKYLSNIIGTIELSIIVTDREFIIKMVNQACCDLLGYREVELVGNPLGYLFDEHELNEELKITAIMKKGEVRNIKKYYLTKDGRKIPVILSSSSMTDDKGEVFGIVCVGKGGSGQKLPDELIRNLLGIEEKITMLIREKEELLKALQTQIEVGR